MVVGAEIYIYIHGGGARLSISLSDTNSVLRALSFSAFVRPTRISGGSLPLPEKPPKQSSHDPIVHRGAVVGSDSSLVRSID